MVLKTHNPYFDNMFSAIRSVAECGERQSDFSHIRIIFLQMLITQTQTSKLMVFDRKVFTAVWYKPYSVVNA